jgi:glycosyltransferase involved in cell wall biosynthesis
VTRQRIPDEILTAAHERARARAARDWGEADRLRGVIEAAGWKVVDRGTDFALSPIAPADIEDDVGTRYGASAKVPSRLDSPATGLATVVIVATDHSEDVERAVRSVLDHAPADTSIVVVADAPANEAVAGLQRLADDTDERSEVVWTSERLGHGAATNVGIRRAAGPVVVLLDPSVALTGDAISPLVAALDDPSVAVVGGWGITSADLRRFSDAPAGDVDAIEGYCQAFRRADAAARGPLDERFRYYRNLDIWWSLVLRDEGEDAAPRRALALDELPLERHEHRGWTSLPVEERDRLSKRNFYRIIDRFGTRRDLLVANDRLVADGR